MAGVNPAVLLVPLVAAGQGTHGQAFTLLFAYLAVAGIGGILLGHLITGRWIVKKDEPGSRGYAREVLIFALVMTGCAVVIFAVLSLATMLVMKTMF